MNNFKNYRDMFDMYSKCVICEETFGCNLYKRDENGYDTIDNICSDCLSCKNNSF